MVGPSDGQDNFFFFNQYDTDTFRVILVDINISPFIWLIIFQLNEILKLVIYIRNMIVRLFKVI